MNFLRRSEPFLYSRKNIAGTLLALAGFAVLVVGFSINPLIALGAAVGLYAVGYLVVPAERGVALTLRETMDARDIEDNLRKLLISLHGRVADDVFTAVGGICHSIIETLPKQGEAYDSVDPNVYLVRQTALEYLPEALNAYLAIPRIYAERRQVDGARTAHDILLDQLQTMDARLEDIRESIARNDMDRLMSNVRFLQERFASSSLQSADVAEKVEGPTVV